jgi:hypothetical protein
MTRAGYLTADQASAARTTRTALDGSAQPVAP